MTQADRAVRVGGAWLAVASALMLVVLGLHGPIASDLGDQMTKIAEAAGRWGAVHWTAAAGLSLYAVGGLILLTSRSPRTDGPWFLSAWAVLSVGALWTVTTAVAETTVVADAAAAGDVETFGAWWEFAEGKAHGFAFVALAIAVIAGGDARNRDGATPTWAAWAAAVAAVGSFGGWALGMWLGVALGNPLWVAASMAMCLWTLAFGIGLARAPSPDAAPRAAATGV